MSNIKDSALREEILSSPAKKLNVRKTLDCTP